MSFRPSGARVRIGPSYAAMRYAEINWNRLPMKGWGGAITALATVLIFIAAYPRIVVYLLPFIALGALWGLLANWWRNR